MDIQDLENKHTSGVYAKRDLIISHGVGAQLFDHAGRAFIDCVGGQGAANLGHGHPVIAAAIAAQAEQLISCPEMFFNAQRAELQARLAEITPEGIERVFLCNSGTEAVEAALKFARVLSNRTQIVAAMRGFHGRTMGALSATWNKKMRTPFAPLLENYTHVPYGKLDLLAGKLGPDTAALILEVVQGEGGVHPGERDYLLGAQQLCRDNGTLLVIDEVQTGFGRTGKMFACEHFGLEPDLMAVAKSMGGGLPIGAVLLAGRLGRLPPGVHGSTFGGNPLAAAAALAAIDILLDEDLPAKAAEKGEYFRARLETIESPQIRAIRGVGLMIGIELKGKVAPLIRALMENGVLALPAGMTVLRLLPPLVISKDEIDTVVNALDHVLNASKS
jgi:acetylornithine/LysW-gamma-L-lysine aminotransferase